ncbi:hypothetical protein HER39_08920 [Arthrobacter deserti]|uniref:Uncharacterized protein n=1 Tax=Arthrobacter deserti TaxID=1742687 RepID=A0ABX1JNL3_9MICC|nr:hypothetical protein [Arthrobacter deserti]
MPREARRGYIFALDNRFLEGRPSAWRAAELAARLGIGAAGLSRHVADLEAAGSGHPSPAAART